MIVLMRKFPLYGEYNTNDFLRTLAVEKYKECSEFLCKRAQTILEEFAQGQSIVVLTWTDISAVRAILKRIQEQPWLLDVGTATAISNIAAITMGAMITLLQAEALFKQTASMPAPDDPSWTAETIQQRNDAIIQSLHQMITTTPQPYAHEIAEYMFSLVSAQTYDKKTVCRWFAQLNTICSQIDATTRKILKDLHSKEKEIQEKYGNMPHPYGDPLKIAEKSCLYWWQKKEASLKRGEAWMECPPIEFALPFSWDGSPILEDKAEHTEVQQEAREKNTISSAAADGGEANGK